MKEETPKQFIQVFIKSEADLPKWGTSYSVKLKNGEFYEALGYNAMQNKSWWIHAVDWYLKPVEPISDEPGIHLRALMEIISNRVDSDTKMNVSDLKVLWNSLSDIVTELDGKIPKS